MKIAVLGAGIVGVTAAWQLLKDGHEVTVIDRLPGPAEFTSFANAGLVAPGHAFAWASPAAPRMMLRSLISGDQAIRFRPRLSLRQWVWVAQFLGQCTDERARLNTAVKAPFCRYSQKVLNEVVDETGVNYAGQKGGLLYFYRTPEVFEAADKKCQILRDAGMSIEVLDADQTVAKDLGLAAAAGQIAGAVYTPDDESGDANFFTIALAKKCAEAGANFRYGEEILDLRERDGLISAIITDKGDLVADAFVLSLGVYSPHLVERLGIRLPIYPVKGYSATLPVTDAAKMPRLGGVDEENLLAYCPMDERLRLTATAEISGYSNGHRPGDFRVMLKRARALFDGAADFENPTMWAGLRPMTPTGMPIIDRSPYPNLWLNTGHGHMGWTMSNGSARILADLIAQRQPAISRAGMEYHG
ncbi:MAG: D-amino acid dehydrogenase [Paracoccaceae bacterium]|nr:D-amino acid dehydrogenase [Paracoccaceae bacterium]